MNSATTTLKAGTTETTTTAMKRATKTLTKVTTGTTILQQQ